jgi:hypothetical protein
MAEVMPCPYTGLKEATASPAAVTRDGKRSRRWKSRRRLSIETIVHTSGFGGRSYGAVA